MTDPLPFLLQQKKRKKQRVKHAIRRAHALEIRTVLLVAKGKSGNPAALY